MDEAEQQYQRGVARMCDFDFVDFVDDELAGSGIIYGCTLCGRQVKAYGDVAPPTDVVCLKQE